MMQERELSQKVLGQAKGCCVRVEGLVLGKSRDNSAAVWEERQGRGDRCGQVGGYGGRSR